MSNNLHAQRFFVFAGAVVLTALYAPPVQSYEPPMGIPAPTFGADETHHMYQGQIFEAGNFVYKDGGNGPYSHYIDNTDPQCTNTSNTYGTMNVPRCTMPSRDFLIPAGSVIEIHGGPYNYEGHTHWTAEGTRQAPIFLRGFDSDHKTRFITSRFRVAGQFLVMENLEVYENSWISIDPDWDLTGNFRSQYIVVRNSEVHKPPGSVDSPNAITAKGNDLLIFRNHLHHNDRGADLDAHGVYVDTGSNRVWILENDIHHNSGNGIQACHQCDPAPRLIYIGANKIHEDRELAIGLKFATDVIISENEIYGYGTSSTAIGTGVVIGADGPTDNVWIIFNKIYDSLNAIRVEESNTDVWILGNEIFDITNTGINLEKGAQTVYVVNNTFGRVGVDINQSERDQFRLEAINNIFSTVTGGSHISLRSSVVSDRSAAAANLFYQDNNSVHILWGTQELTYDSTTAMATFPGGSGNKVENPIFLDALFEDFRLQPRSSGIDSGLPSGVYDEFFGRYNLNIRMDITGISRPQGTGWDMGAHELPDNTIVPGAPIEVH